MHAGSAAAIDNVVLTGDGAANLLLNGDFAHDLAGWFPSAQQYFVPWHIDNLYLETLIEQGIIGVAAYGLLIGSALAGLLSTRGRRLPAAPFLAGSLVGTLVLGLVSSLFDVPRVAALFLFVACLSLHLTALTARKP
jgi:O-antigen ligase